MSEEAGLTIVRELVADRLGLPGARVLPTSRLISDLGADSLDLIDLIFVLEKRFGVKIREGDLAFLAKVDLATGLRDGFVVPEHVARVRPYIRGLEGLEDDKITPAMMLSLITVETLWRMVAARPEGV